VADSDLAARVDAIEAQLRGDPDRDPIDLAAIPLKSLQNQLENNWQPEGLTMLQRKSITAEEIGELPGARLHLAADYYVANASWTGIEFDTVDHDTDKMAELVFGKYVYLRARTAGKYVLTASVNWSGFAGGSRYLGIHVYNGTRIHTLAEEYKVSDASQVPMSVSSIVHMSEDEQVFASVYHNAGGPLPVVTTAADGFDPHWGCHLAAQWVGS
jgi:hypothetical protein